MLQVVKVRKNKKKKGNRTPIVTNEETTVNKHKHAYTLLSGEVIPTGSIKEHDLVWLNTVKDKAESDEDYFTLLRLIRGPGSRALKGGEKLTPLAAQGVLFRVAQDIVERVGIRQGVALPPDAALDGLNKNTALMSTPNAAKLLGFTRAGVHRALVSGRIRGWQVGSVWVVDRADVVRFKKESQASKS